MSLDDTSLCLSHDTGCCLLLTTVDAEETARKIARVLVERQLAACVSVFPNATSYYVWENKLEEAQEWVLLMKTTLERVFDLKAALLEMHPYTLPELIQLPIEAGHAPYLDWVKNAVMHPSE